MSLQLVSEADGLTFELESGRRAMVGRSASCPLAIPSATVSRLHAEIEVVGDGLAIRDLGSTNGTFVNGRRLAEPAIAAVGDVVTFGAVAFSLLATDAGADTGREAAAPDDSTAGPPPGADSVILHRLAVDVTSSGSLLAPSGKAAEDRKARRLALLIEISRELSLQPEADRLLEKLVDITAQVIDVDQVTVLLADETGELVPRVSRSRDPDAAVRPVPSSIARRAVDERLAILTGNAAADQRFGGRSIVLQRVLSAMCAPLVGHDGGVLGLIYVDNLTMTHSFGDEDLEFLAAFSGIAAVAIENSRLIEQARREAVVLNNFQRYFAPGLARQIADQEGEVSLGGEKLEAVILFSDIRGFTTLSEAMRPDEIATLLNEYFTEMVGIVFRFDGVLDKFIGDAVMALWGAPIHHPDDADRAVAAAIEMQRALYGLNRVWVSRGRPELGVGIGINAGEVFAGNIGSDQRLEYTVIGDAVNTASRLCARAGPGEVLVSERVYGALAEPPPGEPLEALRLRGKATEVAVYRVAWHEKNVGDGHSSALLSE